MRLASKAGQNTSEYLLLMTLVVIPAITLLTVYGTQIKAKLAYVSAAVAGGEKEYDEAKKATRAVAYAGNLRVKQKKVKVEGIEKDELSFGLGKE